MNEQERDVKIRIYPDCGPAYSVILPINEDGDIVEQIDKWMDYSLINVQQWELD